MYRGIIFGIAVFSLFMASALTATIYVPDNYATIQEAIDGSVNGDAVIVRPGTYVENLDFKGKAIIVRSELGASFTTIDGNQTKSVVTFMSGEGTDTVLDGFTVTNGDSYLGGGIICFYSSSPTIVNNIITANSAEKGGGLSCSYVSSPTITNNTISANLATSLGGGIFCGTASSPAIVNNTIISNETDRDGGGISCLSNASPNIRNNTIISNSAYDDGGGVYIYESSPTVANNTISANEAHDGGAVYCRHDAFAIFVNNIISDNTARVLGGGFYCRDCSPTVTNNTIVANTSSEGGGGGVAATSGASPIFANTIFWRNSAPSGKEIWVGSSITSSSLDIDHSDVEGGQSSCFVDSGCALNWGTGMIDADPLFVDLAGGDLHLTYPSPCGNAGDAAATGLPTDDFEGDPRAAWNGIDMGADEVYFHLYCMGDVVPGGNLTVRVIGWPTMWTRIALGSGIRTPPISTMHGLFYLESPISTIYLDYIPPNGVIDCPAKVPVLWQTGHKYPLQALVGGFGWPSSRLSNLLTLTVE